MAGVGNFVHGSRDDEAKSAPPPSAQPQSYQRHGRLDRSSAHHFKVKRGEMASASPRIFGQSLTSTSPAPGYNSNSNHTGGRNSPPNPKYQQFGIPPGTIHETGPSPQFLSQPEQHVPIQGGVFDDTLTSGLEDTLSDVQNIGDLPILDSQGGVTVDYDGYGRQHEELHNQYLNQDTPRRIRSHDHSSKHVTQRGLQHKQSMSSLLDASVKQQPNSYAGQPTNGISGRFQAAEVERWQQDIAHRSSPVSGQRANASNKRDRSDELEYEIDYGVTYNGQQGQGDGHFKQSGKDGILEEAELPEQKRRDGHRPKHEIGRNSFEPVSEGSESAASVMSRRQSRRADIERVLKVREQDENRFKPDHKDEDLERMDYADLKEEIWEGEKFGAEKHTNLTQTQNTEFTAEDYFIHMIREGDVEAQMKFFEEMSLAEYEDAGDFFIEKFTGLMKQIRDARKKKRALVTNFENEIEAREKAVRSRSEHFEQKFEAMRAGGEGVLKGEL